MIESREMDSLSNTDIEPKLAIEHVRKNREKAKAFADKIRQGYVPEKRLKDEIVEHIYDQITGSNDKPSYDDLLEFRNFLLNGKNDGQIPDASDNDANKPTKPEVHIEGQDLKDSNSTKSPKKPDNSDTGKQDDLPEEIEGKDYLVYGFKQPLGSVSFNKDRTCTDIDGNVIGMWNEEGKIRDHNGKQIGHLPSSETKRFHEFMDTLGIRYKKGGIYLGDFKIL